MTKMLNLDEIAPVATKSLKFKGETYEMKQLSIGAYIRIQQEAEALDSKDSSPSDQMKFMIKSISDSFPDMGEELIASMSFAQVNAIFDFVRDTAEVENDEAKKTQEQGK